MNYILHIQLCFPFRNVVLALENDNECAAGRELNWKTKKQGRRAVTLSRGIREGVPPGGAQGTDPQTGQRAP